MIGGLTKAIEPCAAEITKRQLVALKQTDWKLCDTVTISTLGCVDHLDCLVAQLCLVERDVRM